MRFVCRKIIGLFLLLPACTNSGPNVAESGEARQLNSGGDMRVEKINTFYSTSGKIVSEFIENDNKIMFFYGGKIKTINNVYDPLALETREELSKHYDNPYKIDEYTRRLRATDKRIETIIKLEDNLSFDYKAKWIAFFQSDWKDNKKKIFYVKYRSYDEDYIGQKQVAEISRKNGKYRLTSTSISLNDFYIYKKGASISKDGEKIAFIGKKNEDYFLSVYSVKEGKEEIFKMENIGYSWVYFSDDKNLIFIKNIETEKTEIKVLDLRTNKVVKENIFSSLKEKDRPDYFHLDIAVRPTSETMLLAFGYEQERNVDVYNYSIKQEDLVELWGLKNPSGTEQEWQRLWRMDKKEKNGLARIPTAAAWSPDGNMFAVGYANGQWEIRRLERSSKDDKAVTSVADVGYQDNIDESSYTFISQIIWSEKNTIAVYSRGHFHIYKIVSDSKDGKKVNYCDK